MYFIGISLVALLCIPSIVCDTYMMAHPECGKLLNLERLAYCCGVSLVDKFLFVGSNCTDYWNNFGACRYECLYNHWKLFDRNNKIKKPELYTMITNLYNPLNGYHRYGKVFKDANEDCEKLGQNYTDFVMLHAHKMQRELGLDTECKPDAMLHTQCIMAHVSHNCPKEFRKQADECDGLRNLIPSCIPEMIPSNVVLFDESAVEYRQVAATPDGASERMPLGGYFILLSSLLSLVLAHLSA